MDGEAWPASVHKTANDSDMVYQLDNYVTDTVLISGNSLISKWPGFSQTSNSRLIGWSGKSSGKRGCMSSDLKDKKQPAA